jgi:hypothetical protein
MRRSLIASKETELSQAAEENHLSFSLSSGLTRRTVKTFPPLNLIQLL